MNAKVTGITVTTPFHVIAMDPEYVSATRRWSVWSAASPLRNQLADDYLKPEARRHGILVITHHLARQWRDTETNELMMFPDLIQRLAATAATIVRNSSGPIEVKCLGIDSIEPR